MKWIFHEMNFLWNVHSMKCAFYEMCILWNGFSMKWIFYEMNFPWNEFSMKWIFHDMDILWNEFSMKWVFYEMNFLWNEFSTKWIFYEMSILWNEFSMKWMCVLKWRMTSSHFWLPYPSLSKPHTKWRFQVFFCSFHFFRQRCDHDQGGRLRSLGEGQIHEDLSREARQTGHDWQEQDQIGQSGRTAVWLPVWDKEPADVHEAWGAGGRERGQANHCRQQKLGWYWGQSEVVARGDRGSEEEWGLGQECEWGFRLFKSWHWKELDSVVEFLAKVLLNGESSCVHLIQRWVIE